jgi:hypothetical protein
MAVVVGSTRHDVDTFVHKLVGVLADVRAKEK